MLAARSQLSRAAEKEIAALDRQDEHKLAGVKEARADDLKAERAEAEAVVADARKADAAALTVVAAGVSQRSAWAARCAFDAACTCGGAGP